jgi:peptidoglycan hydrolase CwlO-like protein
VPRGSQTPDKEVVALRDRTFTLESMVKTLQHKNDELMKQNFELQVERNSLYEQKEDQRKLIHGIANRMNAA